MFVYMLTQARYDGDNYLYYETDSETAYATRELAQAAANQHNMRLTIEKLKERFRRIHANIRTWERGLEEWEVLCTAGLRKGPYPHKRPTWDYDPNLVKLDDARWPTEFAYSVSEPIPVVEAA